MNWENTDFFEDKETASSQNGASTDDMSMEVEERKSMEFSKPEGLKNNLERQEYTTLMNSFGELLVNQCFDDIRKDLLVEDCLCFLFNFFEDKPVVYSLGSNHFFQVYNGAHIKQRIVRATHADVEKNTGFQICEYQVLYEGSTEPKEEVAFETFSFNCSRIINYKVFFGAKLEAHGHEDPFEVTSKEIMLTKVKEFNRALAGPDLEKVASLFQESTEYKIWSWDEQRCFTFHKDDLAYNFHNLEENFTIESIVPYEIYSETRETTYIVSTYVYHLENKTTCPGKKFMWLSTCIFTFDNCLNFAHISQQGELYPEGEIEIPFESPSREAILQRVADLSKFLKAGSDLFYNEKIEFGCKIARYGPKHSPKVGYFKGLKQLEKFEKSLCHHSSRMHWMKVAESFVDLDNPSYDVAIAMNCAEAIIEGEGYIYSGKLMNFVGASLYYLENGKLAKVFQFFCEVPEVIVSPFSDSEFEGVNIKPLRYIV